MRASFAPALLLPLALAACGTGEPPTTTNQAVPTDLNQSSMVTISNKALPAAGGVEAAGGSVGSGLNGTGKGHGLLTGRHGPETRASQLPPSGATDGRTPGSGNAGVGAAGRLGEQPNAGGNSTAP